MVNTEKAHKIQVGTQVVFHRLGTQLSGRVTQVEGSWLVLDISTRAGGSLRLHSSMVKSFSNL